MSRLAIFHRRLTGGDKLGLGERALLSCLVPLGLLYGTVGWLRAALYRWNILRSYRSPVPVVSVGNLAVGGTGKTPTVDFLVKLLLDSGRKVAVVSRGYGGEGGRTPELVSAGAGLQVSAVISGDEPYLLARRNPRAIVIVSRRRADGARLAVEEHGAEVIILDDGFQHLAMRRDLDIVLLDGRRPFGNGHLLPAGLLREFRSALNRANLFLLTRCQGEKPALPALPGPVMKSRHRLADTAVSLEGEEVALQQLAGLKGVAFAGIAEPGSFFAQLREKGLKLVAELPFADHAAYREELGPLRQACSGADYLITTEKDGVKLEGATLSVPCYQVPLSLDIEQEEALKKAIEGLFAKENS